MTGILDLMHALSYACCAARAWDDPGVYRRFAERTWPGRVDEVVAACHDRLTQLGLTQLGLTQLGLTQLGGPPPDHTAASDPRHALADVIRYDTHHRERMHYPAYRRQGLPLTSSHIESTIKQINARVKGTEKFWCRDHADALLQLRANLLSQSQLLTSFWTRWRSNPTGANHYRSTTTGPTFRGMHPDLSQKQRRGPTPLTVLRGR
ncbi:MAG: hypothetical protein KDA75_01755 [Planctomycetaceae bacterium]|nr:hypothetical protein [Planctomycetaceae bacterium]